MLTWSLVAFLVIATITAFLYNRLVQDRNRVEGAWSDVDVQLQRRHDLVPQLVKAVDQYARYERATLEAVTALRQDALRISDVENLGRVEEALSEAVQRLLMIAEQYPDLKADSHFLQLQNELVDTENYLQFARRYYNGSVREFNTRVETVPSNLVAALFGFTCRNFFQKRADEAATVPLVKFGSLE